MAELIAADCGVTRILVIQSYRDHDVPPWIARCLASVQAWARRRGYDYRLVGDEAFGLCGPEYLAKVGPNLRSITNLARLELIKGAHGEGYELAVWVDADVFVFLPNAWAIQNVVRYAFARETWIRRHGPPGRWFAHAAVNNSVFVCRRGEPDLDFLIAATRHVAQHRQIRDNFQVGGDLVKGLAASLAFETLPNVGMFSSFVVRALARNVEGLVEAQARLHGTPVFAANLCASPHYDPPVSAAEAMAAIDVLEQTQGNVVNQWLDGKTQLSIGGTVWFDSTEFEAQVMAPG